MTLTELIAEVYLLTNRPDLVSQTLSAVRSATLTLHRTDFYYKDIFETAVNFPQSEYLQQIEYQSLVPRWRSLKYLRKLDASAAPAVPGKFFDIITPEEVLDTYQLERNDICYVAGIWLQIRSSTAFQYALMGCYLNPLTGSTNGTYESWIAVDHPWAIIYAAAANVSRMIGRDKEARGFDGLTLMEVNLLKASNILANGY